MSRPAQEALCRESQDLLESQPRNQKLHFLLLAVFAFLILFPNLRHGDLSGYDDAFHAEQGKEIVLKGDWWTMRHNGYRNPQFPPLFYWLEAVSMKVWGINDFAAKFPSALLGLGTILVTYGLVWELTHQGWLSLLAMLILLSTQFFMKYATHAMTDVPFTFFFTLALYLYVKGFRNPRYFLWSGLAIGSALLTRPVVGVLVLAIIVLHLIVLGRYAVLWSPHLLAGFLAALLLPSAWYVSQYMVYGRDSVAGPMALLYQQLSSGETPSPLRVLAGSLEYPKQFLKLYWPWLPFLLIGLGKQIKKAVVSREFAATLLVIWVVVVVFPFSVAQAKIFRYIMPVFPAFAILAAMPINQWISSRWKETGFQWLYGLGTCVVIYMTLFPMTLLRATDMRLLAPIAEKSTKPDQRVLLYTSGDMQWGYQNQFLWYANRYSDLLSDLNEVRARVKLNPDTVVIMDKRSHATFRSQEGPEFRTEVLGESGNFVCFRASGND